MDREGKAGDCLGGHEGGDQLVGALQPASDNAGDVLQVAGPSDGGRLESLRARRSGQGVGAAEGGEPEAEEGRRGTDAGAQKKRLVKRARKFESDKAVLPRIEELKREHPAWGYRRIWAYLRLHAGLKLNHKRVRRIMKANGLEVKSLRRLKAPRKPTHKMRSEDPNKLWGTDMTKIMIPSEGWAYLHVVLDWASKKLVG